MTKMKRLLTLGLLLYLLVTSACAYVVLPEGLEEPEDPQAASAGGWTALATGVSQTPAGDLHVDLTIRNDTGDWSTMHALPGQAAELMTGDGETVQCDTVFVGTGGHRFAPGFQMRGYTVSEGGTLKTQLLFVECKGVSASAGSRLSIKYENFNGILDDYDPEMNKVEGVLEINLDEIAAGLVYPVETLAEGAAQEPGTGIPALSENVITLIDAQRTDTGLQFTWQNFNPTKFPLKTHIGIPPVIGNDGILYGAYETLDMAEIPLTPPKENAQWTTDVAVPQDVSGFYILLSVESNKPRTYINYLVDIREK